jgi:hypothetical protein
VAAKRRQTVLVLALQLCAVAPLAAQLNSSPARVLLVVQVPASVQVTWSILGAEILRTASTALGQPEAVVALASTWRLAAGQAASYECRLEGGAGGILALQPETAPPQLIAHSFLPQAAPTRLSLLKGLVPQKGPRQQTDAVLVFSSSPAGEQPSMLLVTVTAL